MDLNYFHPHPTTSAIALFIQTNTICKQVPWKLYLLKKGSLETFARETNYIASQRFMVEN